MEKWFVNMLKKLYICKKESFYGYSISTAVDFEP